MTTAQIENRNGKAQGLQVYRTSEGSCFVASSEGKIAYKVSIHEDLYICTCADFSRNIQKDDSFQCKHIMAVKDAEGTYDSMEEVEHKQPKLNPEFIKNLGGRDYVLYQGLLDLSHQKGLMKLDVHVIQYPTSENGSEAICRAVAETRNGDRFSDIGDASPKNTNKIISSHILRMASTRAKARALRDLTNIGMTALEELGDLDNVISDTPAKNQSKSTRKSSKKSEKQPDPISKGQKSDSTSNKSDSSKKIPSGDTESTDTKGGDKNTKPENGTDPRMSEAQKRAVMNLAKRRGISEEELVEMVHSTYGVEVEALTAKDASQFIRTLQQAA